MVATSSNRAVVAGATSMLTQPRQLLSVLAAGFVVATRETEADGM
jgi:hypothetical protein